MTTPLIITIAFTVLWVILFFKQTAKPMPQQNNLGARAPEQATKNKEKEGSCGRVAEGYRPVPLAAVSPQQGNLDDDEPEDPFDVEYDPEEEARNSYTMQVEDEILRRNGIL